MLTSTAKIKRNRRGQDKRAWFGIIIKSDKDSAVVHFPIMSEKIINDEELHFVEDLFSEGDISRIEIVDELNLDTSDRNQVVKGDVTEINGFEGNAKILKEIELVKLNLLRYFTEQDKEWKHAEAYAMVDETVKRKAQASVLGRPFLRAAEEGNSKKVKLYLDAGFPIGYQSFNGEETALHVAASCRARRVVRMLVKRDDIDYLVRDRQGRLASELAFLFGRDVAMARLLGIKERKQGEAQGIKVTRRPLPQP